MNLGRVACVIAAVGAMQVDAPRAHAGDGVSLVPHRAFYSVTLSKARSSSDVVGASGAMELTLGRTCEGWHLSQRFVLDLESATGTTVRQDTTFAGWESPEAGVYRFTARERIDGDTESYRGMVKRSPESTVAVFSAPDDRSFVLPANVLFPVSHTLAILRAANEGKNRHAAPVFDGAVGKNAQDTVTFIGRRIDEPAKTLAVESPLLNHPAWPMRTAYFDPEITSGEPDFEVGAIQLENGVSAKIDLDYDIFSLRLRLEGIESLPEPHC